VECPWHRLAAAVSRLHNILRLKPFFLNEIFERKKVHSTGGCNMKNDFRKPDKIIVVNKENIAITHKGMVRIAAWNFDKRLVFTNNDGSSSEIPHEETMVVIAKKDTSIWLTPNEIGELKQMLEEITETCMESLIKNCEVKI
jgi:metal-dependent hydrolase (beta-lactamase superfamily II)